MCSHFSRFSLRFSGAFGLALAALLVSLYSVSPAYAGGVVGNGTSGSCTEAAFNTALSGGGNVTFNCGGAKTITLTARKEISVNTTIDGGGVITVSGGNNTDLFQVFVNRTLILQNITLANGRSTLGAAGAVENFGTTSITNSRLTNNHSTTTGGAIYNTGSGVLTLTNTIVSSNTATNNGGGISIDPGTVAVLQNSTFTNNNGGSDGGAIFINFGATVILTSSTLISNTAGSGGGIENTGTLTTSQTIITLNRATSGNGGGVWNFGGKTLLQDTTVSSNTATATGGGISNFGLDLTLNRVTVSSNTAGGFGGGIFSSALATLTNVTLSGNHADVNPNGGGGMYQDNGTATLNYVTVADNTSHTFGGGLYKQGTGTMTVRDTLLTNNKLADNSLANCDGVVGSAGHNLSNDTHCGFFIQTGDQTNIPLLLGPLANNGGPTSSPTLTHRPLSGNPAIDGGDCIGGITTDQRSFARPSSLGPICDVGAVEVGPSMFLPAVLKQ